MTLTQKGTRVVAASTAEDILETDPETVASGKKEKEDDKSLDNKKRDKAIGEQIGGLFKPPSRNEDKEDEVKEEDVGAPIASTEEGSSGEEDNEGREDEREDDSIYNRKDTVLYNAEDNQEEASSGHEGQSSLSNLSESSDDGDEEEDGNGAKDINNDGNGGADKNNGAVGGYVEWLSFLSSLVSQRNI